MPRTHVGAIRRRPVLRRWHLADHARCRSAVTIEGCSHALKKAERLVVREEVNVVHSSSRTSLQTIGRHPGHGRQVSFNLLLNGEPGTGFGHRPRIRNEQFGDLRSMRDQSDSETIVGARSHARR